MKRIRDLWRKYGASSSSKATKEGAAQYVHHQTSHENLFVMQKLFFGFHLLSRDSCLTIMDQSFDGNYEAEK